MLFIMFVSLCNIPETRNLFGVKGTIKQIFGYLKGTINLGLHFVQALITALRGYCDADWAESKDDCRSNTGFAVFMGDNLLSWGAKKQATILSSTTKAEYRALTTTTTELMWFLNLLQSIGFQLLLLHCIVIISVQST